MIDKKLSPKAKEELYENLKNDAIMLSKMKHPHLLNVLDTPLEDTKNIVFVTEPVLFSMAEIHNGQVPQDLIPCELESKCIILEIMEGVHFLHNNAKIVHTSISPHNLFITPEGRIRIGGLNFCKSFSASADQQLSITLDLM
jgi:SCY1-like protein 2